MAITTTASAWTESDSNTLTQADVSIPSEPAGSNKVLLLFVGLGYNARDTDPAEGTDGAFQTATVGGQSGTRLLTPATEPQRFQNLRLQVFRWTDAQIQNFTDLNYSVSRFGTTDAQRAGLIWVWLENVNQVTLERNIAASGSGIGGGSPYSQNITTVSGDEVISICASRNSSATITLTGGQTLIGGGDCSVTGDDGVTSAEAAVGKVTASGTTTAVSFTSTDPTESTGNIISLAYEESASGDGGSILDSVSPTLDGAAVDIADGAVRAMTLEIPAAEYATPFWIVIDGNTSNAYKVDSLPITIAIYGGNIQVRSTAP